MNAKKSNQNNNIMQKFQEGYFKFLKSKAKDTPNIIIEAAVSECIPIFEKMSTNAKGQVGGDRMLLYMSQFAGIACLRAAVSEAPRLIIENKNGMMSLMQVDTEAGIFYMGEVINKYLFYDDNSICNYILKGLGGTKEKYKKELENIITNCTKNYGNKEFRVWNHQVNPYQYQQEALHAYEAILQQLSKYELSSEQMIDVYGLMLSKMLNKVKNIFPKDLDPVLMVFENVIFNAHMDYVHTDKKGDQL